jgi:hypothetical protein
MKFLQEVDLAFGATFMLTTLLGVQQNLDENSNTILSLNLS